MRGGAPLRLEGKEERGNTAPEDAQEGDIGTLYHYGDTLWARTCAHEACASTISAFPRSCTSSTAIEVSERCFLIWRLRERRVKSWWYLVVGKL